MQFSHYAQMICRDRPELIFINLAKTENP